MGHSAVAEDEVEDRTFRPRAVAVDYTYLYKDDAEVMDEIGGGIFALYLYDEGVGVHLCEVTVSRDLRFLTFETLEDDEDFDSWSQWYDAISDDIYMNVSEVDKLPTSVLPDQDIPEGEDEEECWCEIVEFYMANPPWPENGPWSALPKEETVT